MKTFSTTVTSLAAGAVLVTAGMGAADAAGPEADRSEVQQDLTGGKAAAQRPAATKMDRDQQIASSVNGAAGGIRDYCVGRILESKDLVNGYGTTIGRVELWYSSTAGPGGQNCVITHNYLDGRNYTDATLMANDDRDDKAERWSEDMGRFYSYAGGSYLNHINGTCVHYYGRVDGNNPNSTRDDAWYGSDWVRCG